MRGIDGDPDIAVALVDDFLAGDVDAGIELGEGFERRAEDLDNNGRRGQFTAGGLGLFAVFFAPFSRSVVSALSNWVTIGIVDEACARRWAVIWRTLLIG